MTWMSDLSDMIAGPYDQAHIAALVLFAGEMAMTLDAGPATVVAVVADAAEVAAEPQKTTAADRAKRYRERKRSVTDGVTRDVTPVTPVTIRHTERDGWRDASRLSVTGERDASHVASARAVTTKDLSSKAVAVGTGSSESLSFPRANDRNRHGEYDGRDAERDEKRDASRTTVTQRDVTALPFATAPASRARAQQVAPLQQQNDYRDRAAGADVQARLDAMDAEQSGVEPVNRAMQLSVALGADVSDKLRAYFKRHSVSINLQRAYVDTIAGALAEPGILPIDVASACVDDETNPVVKGAFGFRRFVVTAAAERIRTAAAVSDPAPSQAIPAHRAGFITARAANRAWGEPWAAHCAAMAKQDGLPTWLHWADKHFDDPWPPPRSLPMPTAAAEAPP